MMNKLFFALLLIAAMQPAVLGKRINIADFDKLRYGVLKPTPHPDSYAYDFATAATEVTAHKLLNGGEALSLASNSRRAPRRAGGTVVSKLRRPPADKTLPTLNTGVPKTVSKARKTALKNGTREDATRPLLAVREGRTKRTPGSRTRGMVTYQSGESLRIVKGPNRKGQEHYDPNRSGNPLLDTSGKNRIKKISDDFSVKELARSGKKTFGIARIDPQLVVCLQAIRNYVGRAVIINSGYRSFWHNIDIYRWMGKKPTSSQHISGRASDIKIAGMTGLEIAQAAIDACGPNVAIGVGREYAHIDVRGEFGVWKYRGVTNQQLAQVRRYRTTSRVAQRGRSRRPRRGSLSKRV